MARRTDHTREELTALAIDCGVHLVREQGPDALTARNVAKAMGYTPGTLYNIFDNLEGLIVAINTHSAQQLAKRIGRIHESGHSAEQRIHAFCRSYLDFQTDEPELWKLLFAAPINNDKLSQDFRDAVHKVFDPVTEALLPISGNPTAARKDAKIIWSTLHGICLLHLSNKLDVTEADPTEDLIERFLDRFLCR
ncbi:TetR/AcrR family transcriptional regulator [Coraliomargarita akajimensis]|uniref:Transcriptional regulator, TetR family n=1 Tax=Coraliomargarita akajimensis (strain DSM 45221 / IAM 15411 / JCM 23193 / KCTC 12865 / 04OKA010-24) TaxID=583355 RepID=D5EKB0_CORAD|nr:TetR/AcrR family transcriptional regulator [Coraliomargarita akajimensis]ADE54859.1 transcriptional regulator, TetR family [Coraliomargarita akajimensis DSM 45221]